MRTTGSINAVRRQVAAWRAAGDRIGFIPTMGALHVGHESLIKRCRRTCDRTVVSIFVNPTQFGRGEDFGAYPRPRRRDLAICRKYDVDLVFAPSAKTMYPDGFVTMVHAGPLGDLLEGAIRPGHFDGVATVVLKLFDIVAPDVAIFGQKDYQQLLIIRQLVRDFDLPVRIVMSPTIRESDGLAVSSRNVYLDAPSRVAAKALSEALRWAKAEVRRGHANAAGLKNRARKIVESTGDFKLDYLSLCNPLTLKEKRPPTTPLVILIAATCLARGRAKGRRFIDNILVS